jgi:chromosome segregation ATPase
MLTSTCGRLHFVSSCLSPIHTVAHFPTSMTPLPPHTHTQTAPSAAAADKAEQLARELDSVEATLAATQKRVTDLEVQLAAASQDAATASDTATKLSEAMESLALAQKERDAAIEEAQVNMAYARVSSVVSLRVAAHEQNSLNR